MAIVDDGWLDWAERVPGHPSKTNGGRNPVMGFVAHSAEGWEPALRSLVAALERQASWHFSNLKDGRLLQHYSIWAQCWHGGSGLPNNTMVSMEHEGIVGQQLTEAQVETTARVIGELAAFAGWKPRRPEGQGVLDATLYEHRELNRFGSQPTACPSGRIPWAEILARLEGGDMANLNGDGSDRIESRDGFIYIVKDNVPVLRIGGGMPGQLAKLFGDRYFYIRGLTDDGQWASSLYLSETPGD